MLRYEGVGGWIVANALSDAWSLAAGTWGWLPPEWFDLHLLISRVDRELASLDASVEAIHVRVAEHHNQEKELLIYRKKLETHLKKARNEITDMARQRSASMVINHHSYIIN